MLKNKKIGFIGGGNMAEAMIKGLLSASFIEAKNVFVGKKTLHASSLNYDSELEGRVGVGPVQGECNHG